MTTLHLDFRQALRSLLRAPGFLLTATACLALGLGANLAVISHLDRMVLRPLPFPDSSRLAVLQSMDTRAGGAGPLSQITQQRRREIGIRISLGASPARVVREVLSGAGGLVGLGLLLGSALGWALSRTLEQLLFGLKTPGPAIYLGVFALLVPAALLACLIPALRAACTKPAEVLRGE
jgi:putative ABC transport system permease protein